MPCVISNGRENMIDSSPYQHCECLRMTNSHDVCQGELTLQEKGKKLTLSLWASEKIISMVLVGLMDKILDRIL